MNSFQEQPSKRSRRRRRGRSKTPEGRELSEYEKKRKAQRDLKKAEWEAVKVLPKGSGKIDSDKSGSDNEGNSSFSGIDRNLKIQLDTMTAPTCALVF